MRILRIFKMVRHFVGLQSLVYTLHQAYKVRFLTYTSFYWQFEMSERTLIEVFFLRTWA